VESREARGASVDVGDLRSGAFIGRMEGRRGGVDRKEVGKGVVGC